MIGSRSINTRRRVVASRIIRFHRRCKSKQQTSDPAESVLSSASGADHTDLGHLLTRHCQYWQRRILIESRKSIDSVTYRECNTLETILFESFGTCFSWHHPFSLLQHQSTTVLSSI